MYKAIIIEDEQNAADLLEEMLMEISPAIKIMEKCCDLPSGIKSIRKHNPFVVFLDIELPVYSGIQILDFFEPEDINFNIIFTTAYSQYAVRAFELCAVDYLMKPLQENQLKAAINKLEKGGYVKLAGQLPALKQNFQDGASKRIVLPVTNGFEIINVADIFYLKAEGSYTRIFCINNITLLASRNLKHFQFVLEGAGNFFRIHRSIIVNIRFAKKLMRNEGATLILNDQTELPVANDRVDELLNCFRNV